MSISARTVFKGTVTALQGEALNAEVEISTAGGDKVLAILTETSAAALGLAVGASAVAVVKASMVTVQTRTPQYRFSARNQLQGKISGLLKGGVDCLVKVILPGGTVISAMITHDAIEELGLAIGVPVTAIFKASDVLVGVPA